MGRCMDGWMDEWIDGWTDGWMEIKIDDQLLIDFLDSHSKLLSLRLSFICKMRIVAKFSLSRGRLSQEQEYADAYLMPGQCKPLVLTVEL